MDEKAGKRIYPGSYQDYVEVVREAVELLGRAVDHIRFEDEPCPVEDIQAFLAKVEIP